MTAKGPAPQSSSRSLAVLASGSFVNAACGLVLTFVLPPHAERVGAIPPSNETRFTAGDPAALLAQHASIRPIRERLSAR